jgi:hypothetical protein
LEIAKYFCFVQDPAQPFSKEFGVRVSNWTSLEADWVSRLRPFLTERGVSSFGSIGTCWGTYVTVKTATLPEFKAGVRQAYMYFHILIFLNCSLNSLIVVFSALPVLIESTTITAISGI